MKINHKVLISILLISTRIVLNSTKNDSDLSTFNQNVTKLFSFFYESKTLYFYKMI